MSEENKSDILIITDEDCKLTEKDFQTLLGRNARVSCQHVNVKAAQANLDLSKLLENFRNG